MSEVVELDSWRPARSGDEPYRCVRCGGEWFTLAPKGGPAAVCLRADGSVSGYAGVPECMECGLSMY